MDHSAESRRPTLLALGVSHASAPLDLLERLTEAPRPVDDLVRDLSSVPGTDGAVVLATCNRIELYVSADAGVPDHAFGDVLARHSGVPADELRPHLYSHRSDDAVRHLFTVASGLDSVVVGEDQILGQVKQALERSRRLGQADGVLGRAMQAALRVGRRARGETGLNEAGRSLATAGLAFFEQRIGPLTGGTALVMGAGAMAGVVVAALRRSGVARVHVANRTPEKAQRLAETAGGEGFPLERVPELLTEVDLVIGCVTATGHLLTADDVRVAMKARQERPLFILDLALPHNIAPGSADIPGVVFVDLRRISEESVPDDLSAESVDEARRIVDEAVAEFRTSVRAANAAHILSALRGVAAEATEAELGRLSRRLQAMGPAEHQEISRSVHRIVDKVLHLPTVRARQLATSSDGAVYIDALRRLFAPQNGEKEMEVIS